tara:strand:- start:125 stop:442 length:318 start_codon:yes stop_codon:yes gene_type:complete
MTDLDHQFNELLKDVYNGSLTSLSIPNNAYMLAKELRRYALIFSQLDVVGQAERGQSFLIRSLEDSASMLEATESGDLIDFLTACKQANYSPKDIDHAVQSVFGA